MDRKFVFKEESPGRVVIKIWDETLKDFLTISLIMVPICLIIGGGSYFLYATIDEIVCLFIGGILVIGIACFRISSFLKVLLPPHQNAIIDLNIGIANGIKTDFVKNKRVPWQFEVNQVDSLKIVWDDPRFDTAILEIHDSKGSVLHAFYGGRAEMRQIGDKLKVRLHVSLYDNAYDQNFF